MKLLEEIDIQLNSNKEMKLYIYEHNGLFFRNKYSGLEDASDEDIAFELGNMFNKSDCKEDCIVNLHRICEETDSKILKRTEV